MGIVCSSISSISSISLLSFFSTTMAERRKLKAQARHPEPPDKKAATRHQGMEGVEKTIKDDSDLESSETEEEDTPAWAKRMGKDMGKMLKQMKNVNIKVDEAVNTAKEAKSAVQGLQGDVKDLREDYNTFKSGISGIVSEEVQKEVNKLMSAKWKGDNGGSSPEGEHPERLVIVSGFPAETPENTIENRLQTFVIQNSLQEKVVEVFCFDDPAVSGVLKFRSETGRNAFLRRSRSLKATDIDDDRTMKFSKKLTVVERAAEKRLGYIKNAVMTKLDVGVKEVKIDWRKHLVEHKSVTIFQVTPAGERVYDGVGKEVRQEVEEKMKAWFEKRESEDSE